MGEIPGFAPEEITEAMPEIEAAIPFGGIEVQVPLPKPERTILEPVVIFDRQAFDRQWNKDKRTQRLANLAIAHGYVHTASGRTYYDHGTSSRPRKK